MKVDFDQLLQPGPAGKSELLRRLQSLSEFASCLTYAGTLRDTLDALCRKALAATEGQACALVLRDSRDPQAIFRALTTVGLPAEGPALFEIAIRSGFPPASLQAYESRQTVVTPGAKALLARVAAHNPPPQVRALVELAAQQAWDVTAAVPIVREQAALGLLQLYWPAGVVLSQEDLAFLGTVADLAGAAIDNARLLQVAEERAALEERQRLAFDLHDSVAQALYAIGLGIRTVQGRLGSSAQPGVQEELDHLAQLADAAQKELRASMQALQPEVLHSQGLAGALEQQAEVLRLRHGLQVELEAQEPLLDEPKRLALFRVALEGLHNVVKHARASRVWVRLHQGESVELSIKDDGCGFDPQVVGGGLGLKGMRDRMLGVGGYLEVGSSPQGGTCLQARLGPPR